MEDLGLIVLGAIVGAIATGGVSAFEIRSRRKTDTRVAARVILGDLYVVEEVCALILKRSAWPDRLDLSGMVEDWREQRVPFARGVAAWEWALVDGFYNNLNRTLPMVELGGPCTQSDVAVIESVHKSVPRTREVVLRHVAKSKELNRLVTELSARDAEINQ